MLANFFAFLRAANSASDAFGTFAQKLPKQKRVVGVPDKRAVASGEPRGGNHRVADVEKNFRAVGIDSLPP